VTPEQNRKRLANPTHHFAADFAEVGGCLNPKKLNRAGGAREE
jgi:hypothetical protein